VHVVPSWERDSELSVNGQREKGSYDTIERQPGFKGLMQSAGDRPTPRALRLTRTALVWSFLIEAE